MDTVIRDHHEIFLAVPPTTPPEAEISDPHAEPEVDNDTPTYLHPTVIVVASAGYGWMLLVFWIAFAGYGYMTASMTIATLISGTMLGLMAAGGAVGRNMQPGRRPWRSFREFLAGEVEVWGARVSGREAFIQLATMSWLLAALASVFAILVACDRP